MSVFRHGRSSCAPRAALAAIAALVLAACHHAPPPDGGSNETDRSQASRSRDAKVRRIAGAEIVQTNYAGFVVRIHGGMVGSGEPLYVIDGAPLKLPSGRGIDWFAPEDIASIKVLKYPQELAEYGPNGANGVVVITTKQGAGRSRRP